MRTVDDLVTWLRAQLDTTEASTRKLLYWAQQTILTLQDPKLLGKHIPGWHDWPDVERMCQERLADVDAKRRILDDCEDRASVQALRLARLVALPFAARPGYRDEWRP